MRVECSVKGLDASTAYVIRTREDNDGYCIPSVQSANMRSSQRQVD